MPAARGSKCLQSSGSTFSAWMAEIIWDIRIAHLGSGQFTPWLSVWCFFFFLEGFLVWRWIKSCATNCAAYYVTTIPAHCQLKDGDKTSCIEGLSNIRLAWVIEINIDQPWSTMINRLWKCTDPGSSITLAVKSGAATPNPAEAPRPVPLMRDITTGIYIYIHIYC